MGRKRKTQVSKRWKVALMIAADSHTYSQRKVQGIISYFSRHTAWDIFRNALLQPFVSVDQLEGWEGDGIIGEVRDQETADLIEAMGIPFVNTASVDMGDRFPSVMLDNRLIGKMAAEHLLKRKIDQFVFVAADRLWLFQERFHGFNETVTQAGGECISLFYQGTVQAEPHYPSDFLDVNVLCEVVQKLSFPVGIMAASDEIGFLMLEACRKQGIRSPEEVSLIGVNNDTGLFCELASPTMSSVDVSAEEVGFTAAQMLDDLMEGRPLEKRSILIPPRQIVMRDSTDMIRTKTPEVAGALRFIRRHEHEFIGVIDVMNVIPVSRRWLELKFREEVGWGIYHEIRRVHVERAKQLFQTTDWPVERVMQESGFKTMPQLDAAFEKMAGMTVLEFCKSRG